jgi:hypothetical protein
MRRDDFYSSPVIVRPLNQEDSAGTIRIHNTDGEFKKCIREFRWET